LLGNSWNLEYLFESFLIWLKAWECFESCLVINHRNNASQYVISYSKNSLFCTAIWAPFKTRFELKRHQIDACLSVFPMWACQNYGKHLKMINSVLFFRQKALWTTYQTPTNLSFQILEVGVLTSVPPTPNVYSVESLFFLFFSFKKKKRNCHLICW
jgi:hypothetical protein